MAVSVSPSAGSVALSGAGPWGAWLEVQGVGEEAVAEEAGRRLPSPSPPGLPAPVASVSLSSPGRDSFYVGTCQDEPEQLDDWNRIAELQQRNRVCPPHLKTCYPLESRVSTGVAHLAPASASSPSSPGFPPQCPGLPAEEGSLLLVK